MYTTIQVSKDLKKQLDLMKESESDSYNSVLGRILEDYRDVTEQVKRDIVRARKEFSSGRFKAQEEVEKEFGV